MDHMIKGLEGLSVEFPSGMVTTNVEFDDGEMHIKINAKTTRGQKSAVIKVRDYDRMIPPLYAFLPPVCVGPDDMVYITSYCKFDPTTRTIMIPNEHHRANDFDPQGFEKILMRAIFSDIELSRFEKDFGWKPAGRFLTYPEFLKVTSSVVPSCYNAARWRLLRKNIIVYEKILSKLYQFTCENMSAGMLQRIASNENMRKIEYIPNRMKARDVAGKVILPFGNPTKIYNHEYLVMSDTQQSGKAGEMVHLSLGTVLGDDGSIVTPGSYPVSFIFSHNPFHRHISPNRQVVSRYITQACELPADEKPLIINPTVDRDPVFRPNGLNLLAARMEFHGYTHEDNCILSDETAAKFLTIVKHYDIFRARDPILAIKPMNLQTADLIRNFKSITDSISECVNHGHLGTCRSGALRSSLQRKAIVTDIRIEQGDDANQDVKFIQIESCYPLRLAEGDKLADLHGNKVTVARILPKRMMPQIKGRPVDIIVPPYLGKRCCPGRILEEMYSILARKTTNGEMPLLEKDISLEDITKKLKQYKENGKTMVVDWERGDWHEDVSYGWVRYFRLEQHASVKAKASPFINMDYRGVVTRGKGMYNLADVMFSLLSVGAMNIIKEIIDEVKKTNCEEMVKDHMKCFGFNLETGIIKKIRTGFLVPKDQIDGIVIDKPLDRMALTEETEITESEIRERTVLDPRLLKSNGYIRVPAGMSLILESFAKAINVPSWNPTEFERTWRMDKDKVETADVFQKSDGNMYIRLPRTLKAHMLNNGNYTVSDIQNSVNTLLSYFNNYEKHKIGGYHNDYVENSMIIRANGAFNMIMNCIATKLFKKSGIIRMMTFPRVLRSAHAVIVGNPELDLETCEIPVKLFNKWMYSKEFRISYQLPETTGASPDISNSDITPWRDLGPGAINAILDRQNAKCLLTRNPAHQINNVASFKMKVWNGNAIRFNPALVTIFDGDFDGDTMIAYAPLTDNAKKDLEKIWIGKLHHLISNKKALKNLKIVPNDIDSNEKVKAEFFMTTGISESIEDIEKRYSKEKKEDFDLYMKGHDTVSSTIKRQALAAAEYRFMKDGAANAGNIGNILRNTMFIQYGAEGITHANTAYHSLAQPALDSKNSEGMKQVLDIVTGMIRSLQPVRKDDLRKGLDLLISNPKTIDKVIENMFDGENWRAGVSVMCARMIPVVHCITSGGVISLHRAAAVGDDGSVVSKFLQMATKATSAFVDQQRT